MAERSGLHATRHVFGGAIPIAWFRALGKCVSFKSLHFARLARMHAGFIYLVHFIFLSERQKLSHLVRASHAV